MKEDKRNEKMKRRNTAEGKKRKGRQEKEDFRQIKFKLMTSIVIFFVLAAVFFMLIYGIVFYGRFANTMIWLIEHLTYSDYNRALYIYTHVIRDYSEGYVLLAVLIIFFIFFSIYLNYFTKYFKEINRGIDSLLDDDVKTVDLSPELRDVEKKINQVKSTLIKRKYDAAGKNDLIIYLAHDLKTPLASVIGYLNLLHDEQKISEELRQKYLSISLEKAERLEDLINEFFEISRYNLSEISIEPRRINLTRLLEMLLYEFRPMLDEKELKCKLDAKEDIMLQADGDKLQRVFDNLLKNAVIYSYAGTEIAISAKIEADSVRVTFINSGEEIPPDKLERIFEQFYRLDAARSTQNGGAGLGLAIAKKIVELHEGRIYAESGKEFTKFTVELPVEGE